jgi:hypothetical protein
MIASLSLVLSGSVETAVCRFSTTSSRFAYMQQHIFDTGGRGKQNGGGSGSGRDGILSIIVI